MVSKANICDERHDPQEHDEKPTDQAKRPISLSLVYDPDGIILTHLTFDLSPCSTICFI